MHPEENNTAFPNQTHCPTVSPEESSGVIAQARLCKKYMAENNSKAVTAAFML